MERGSLALLCLCSLYHLTYAESDSMMKNVIVVSEDISKVKLKCRLPFNETSPSDVRWDYTNNSSLIMERTPSGELNIGSNYSRRSVDLEPNGDLTIHSPVMWDSGIYACQNPLENGVQNWTTKVYLIVNKAVSEDDRTRATIISILISLDIILLDINVILLLTHCDVYRRHKDIWSLRLFFLSYYIIYGVAGLVFLILYLVKPTTDFLYNVGSTCSATSVPPIIILWIDYIIIVKRNNKRRIQMKEHALLEDMIPVIQEPGYISNGENGRSSGSETRYRKRYTIQDKPSRSKRSTCCSGEKDDGDGTETVELTGHRGHIEHPSPSQPT